jgi:tetratricopeptide (TPR) repeat protein
MAYASAQKGDYQAGLDICDFLIQGRDTEIAGLRERADIKVLMGDIVGAIDDLEAITSGQSREPADLYLLGSLLIQRGLMSDAIAALTRTIEACAETGSEYYLLPSYFLRAYAYLGSGQYERVMADCIRLPDGYRAYVNGAGMWQKEDMAREALKGVT